MIISFISHLESAKVKSITPTSAAQEQWVEMVDQMSHLTLFPLTNSWWTGGNIPGKKVQMLTYVLGIDKYEAQCRAVLDKVEGFDIQYQDGRTEASTDKEIDGLTVKAAMAAA